MSLSERPTFGEQLPAKSFFKEYIQSNIHRERLLTKKNSVKPDDTSNILERNLPGIRRVVRSVIIDSKPIREESTQEINTIEETLNQSYEVADTGVIQEKTSEQKLFDYISKFSPGQIRYIVDSYYGEVYPNLVEFNDWKYGEDKLGNGLTDILIEIKNIVAKEEKYQISEIFSFISRLRDLY
jgi:hypothetical protein